MPKAKQIELEIVSAIVLDGQIVSPGAVIKANDREARNLLQRGKAVLATADDADETEGDEGDQKASAEPKPKTAKADQAKKSDDKTVAGE